MQEAFTAYLVDANRAHRCSSIVLSDRYRKDPSFAHTLPYVTVAEAARLLDTTPIMVKLLIRLGLLAGQSASDDGQSRRVARAAVDALRATWAHTVGITETRETLGVSKTLLLRLVERGMLRAVTGPPHGFPEWVFHRDDVAACYDRVIGLTAEAPADEAAAMVNVKCAARLLDGVGLDTVSLWMRVADGALAAYRQRGVRARFDTLLFRRADIARVRDGVDGDPTQVGSREARATLGITPQVLTRWVEHGVLTPVAVRGNASYFDRHLVETFWDRHVDVQAAARLIGEEPLHGVTLGPDGGVGRGVRGGTAP